MVGFGKWSQHSGSAALQTVLDSTFADSTQRSNPSTASKFCCRFPFFIAFINNDCVPNLAIMQLVPKLVQG